MKVEIRNNSVEISGYVNVVERESRPIRSSTGIFIETVKAGVFQRALDKAEDVQILHNHNKDRVLGSVKTGNLELREDNVGLYAKAIVTDPTVIEKARNKELRGWSFGFIKNKDRFEPAGENLEKRYLEDITLTEVSILDITPAYVATSVEVRSETEEPKTEERRFIKDNEIEVNEIKEGSIEGDRAYFYAIKNYLKIKE